jgi:YVTN family beta-propeller protein
MGAVYRAEDLGLGRKVALKVIASELAEDSRFRERFLRESRVAASLDHPHVVPIFQAGDDDGVLFIAMRYVEGTDLGQLLEREGALEPARTISLLEQVAEALDAAHEKGLVHRDVKPSNVLIAAAAGKEHCYLADFGLTKRTGSLSGVSAPGDVVGTLEYVAPEQITGDDVDARADVYSLACVMYECLTGTAPFPRATDVALLWAHVHEEPRRPSQVRAELPQSVDGVLARALAKEADRRYGSAGELVAAARSSLGVVEAAPAPRSTRLQWIFGAVALVLAIAAALGLLLTRDSGGGLDAVAPNSVGVIDPASNELVAEVPVGIDPEAMAVGSGSVWVANVEDETLSRIDPGDTSARDRTISVDGYPSDVAVDDGTVWVGLGGLAELVRVNAEQNQAGSPVSALGESGSCGGGPAASLAIGAGAVWFLCQQELGRFDLRTGKGRAVGYEAGLSSSPSSVIPEFADIAFGLGSLWIVDRNTDSVIELDPVTIEKQRPITVGKRPTAIAVSGDSLWVANEGDDTVMRVQIPGPGQTPTLTDIDVPDGPVDVAVGEGGVWVASALDRSVSRIDPGTNEVEKTIAVGNEPRRVAAGEGRVWVSVRASAERAGAP